MNPTIRRVIQAEESGIDFRDAVNTGKIVLVDIQKGEVGDQELEIHDEEVEEECPQLKEYDRSRLEEFCPYREDDGFCTALETSWVLSESDD